MNWKKVLIVAVAALAGAVIWFRPGFATSTLPRAVDARKLEPGGIFLDAADAPRKLTEADVLAAVASVEPAKSRSASTVTVTRVQYVYHGSPQKEPGWMVTLDGIEVPLTGPTAKKYNTELNVVVDDSGHPLFGWSHR